MYMPKPTNKFVSGPMAPDAICTYKTTVFSDSPFAYWRLGETSGTTADNIGSLGSILHGIYQSGVTLPETGLIIGDTNPAAGFDGINHYVMIPSHSSIEAGGPYPAKTVELWFKASDPIATGKHVLYEQGGDKNGLNIYLDGSSLYVGAFATPLGSTYGTWVNTPVVADTIYHVVLVFDGGSQTVTGYLNGTSFGTAATNFTQIEYASRGNGIGGVNNYTLFHDGAYQFPTGDNFFGVIDEVTLYNRVLAQSRIQLHAQGCVTQSCQYQEKVGADDPLAYWRLGESIGTTAFNLGSLGIDVYGIYINGVSLGAGGLVLLDSDTAASFDGVDDYVSIPNHSHINIAGPYTAKTIELWFIRRHLIGQASSLRTGWYS